MARPRFMAVPRLSQDLEQISFQALQIASWFEMIDIAGRCVAAAGVQDRCCTRNKTFPWFRFG